MSRYTITPRHFVTYHLPETFKFLKSLGTNPPTRHSISQCLPSAANKTFFLTLSFSDLMSSFWEQSLLKLCCWLVIACFRSPCHTALNIQLPVTHSPFLSRIEKLFTHVKTQTFRFAFGERFLEALEVHKTLLTEIMSCVECLRWLFSFHVTYYCLTERGPIQ